MLETALILLCGGAMAWLVISHLRSRMQVWQETAESCGLEVVETSFSGNPQLKARSGLVELQIKPSGEAGRSRIAIKVPGPPDFQRVRIRPQAMYQFAHEIEIGDAPFDREFAIDGPERLVSALLDDGMRRLLTRVSVQGRLDLTSSELRLDLSADYVPGALPLFLELGKRLAEPLDVPRRLAENARQDPVPRVRIHNLLLLLRELPGDPVTAEALRAARSDPSLEVRLRVAKAMGAEGHGLLRELAEGLEDDAVSAEAVSALDRALPFENIRTILDHALSRGRFRTARACLKALGATGKQAAEPLLIEALRHDQPEIRMAAASALGRAGSVAAVLPLKQAAERFDLELRRAARQSIAEIQSRLQGASPGQLSLTGAEAGQLSLADDPAGQLSISDDEEVPGVLRVDPAVGTDG